jgi:tripartite-type tricarboxylate transporter receptor subunit TctC
MANAEYPTKPIRIIVPFPAAGPGDMLARILAERFKASWGQDVEVDIRPGINGIVGSAIGAKAAPDGYTLIIAASAHYVNPSIYRNLPFDPFGDFSPISLVAGGPNVMVFNAAVPLYSVAEVIAYSKANSRKLRYASGGHGSPSHLAGELFNMIAGTDLVHVPYHGHAAAGVALSEGKDVQLMFDAVFTCMSHIKNGDWRALAVTTTKRASALPGLPTMVEAGLSGYEVSPAMGLLAPRETPKHIVNQLSAEVARIMRMPEIVERIRGFGAEPMPNSPEQYSDYIKSEIAKWARVVKHAGIEMQNLPALPPS